MQIAQSQPYYLSKNYRLQDETLLHSYLIQYTHYSPIFSLVNINRIMREIEAGVMPFRTYGLTYENLAQ